MKKMRLLLALFIAFSLIAVQSVVAAEEHGKRPEVHIMFGSITTIFGIIALAWTYSARKKLAAGSSLREYISNLLVALLLILGASAWHLIRESTQISVKLGEVVEYPEYLLYIFAYLVLVLAAYRLKFIGEEFSFEEQASAMQSAIAESESRKKPKK